MSVQSRAPARSRPGAHPSRLRRDRFLALAASAAAALGLVLTVGPAASAATHTAAPAAALHTYHVAPNGTDTSGSCPANTAQNAFPTVADALACAVSGDAISLAPTGTTPYQGFGTVSQNITIAAASGANARTVTVDATLSSNLTVAAGATVTVSGVTIDGSNDPATPDVTNDGTLTLTRDAITNNLVNAGILDTGGGAGLTLNADTVSGNAGGEGGGGIDLTLGATLTANNSTIANNIGGSTVGGVDLNPGTSATFVNSTITGNQDNGVVGGLQVWPSATATLSNTIIAGNTGGSTFPDCHGVLTDGPGGHNLIGNASTGCTGLANNVNGDQVNASAGLMPLANNGGPTNTAAVVAGSPAVGAGNTATCTAAPISNKDQRGDSRKVTCDIGAYDTNGKIASLHTYHVAPGGTDTSGSCTANTAHNAFPTIAAALACATDDDAISLAPTGATPYQGFGTVSHNITISAASGANARTVVIDATNSANLTVAAGSDVVLTGVTIDGSNDVSSPDVTDNGVLTLTRDAITNNVINSGIVTQTTGPTDAGLTLNASTVSGNVGGQGGGGINLFTGPAALRVNNSTIDGNLAGSTVGGVDLNPGAAATFVNSTITGNADSPIGGLQVWPGATATVSNTIIAGNTGTTAPDCHGTLTDGPGGHNLIGNATICTGLTNGVNGDQIGVATPGLGSLASNGGPTDTVGLTAGSPAIGGGAATTCEMAPIANKDQRGDSRNATTRGACDIGAYDTGGA